MTRRPLFLAAAGLRARAFAPKPLLARALLAASLLTAALLAAAAPLDQARATDLGALLGRSGGGATLAAPDGYDFNRFAEGATARIDLFVEPPAGRLRGVAILSHGSSGRRGRRQSRWAAMMRARGWATITIDHFSTRGVGSTVRDQLAVSEQQMMGDLLAVAAAARADPAFAGLPIVHVGWSKGASAGFLASVDRFAAFALAALDAPPEKNPLDAVIGFYPFCGVDLAGETSGVRLKIIHGEDDDWTPIGVCRDAVAALRETGADAELLALPGARHGFDAWGAPRRRIARAVTVRTASSLCLLRVRADGLTAPILGVGRLDGEIGRLAYLAACGERGVTIGGAPTHRATVEAAFWATLEGL